MITPLGWVAIIIGILVVGAVVVILFFYSAAYNEKHMEPPHDPKV